MAQALVLYTRIHAPLPLRLPAQPFPTDAHADDVERCLFDLHAAEEAFRDVIAPAYLRAFEALRGLVEGGVPLSIGVSDAFLRLSRRWSPELLRPIRHLLRAPAVEAVAVEPWGGLLFGFDIEAFMRTMSAARERIGHLAGSPPRTAEVSGFCLNHEIYHALWQVGFAAMAAEGAAQARAGHEPGHPGRWRDGPLVLYRLEWLSDELRYQLRGGRSDPAGIAATAAGIAGEAALAAFEFDDLAFGPEGAGRGADLLGAVAAAATERGVEPLTIARAARRFERRAVESPPPITTAMAGLSIEDMVGDGWTERLIFGRMQQAYQAMRLVGDHGLREFGGCLLQRVNLSLPRMADDLEARPPTYWRTPMVGENGSYDSTTSQVLAVYDNFIRAAASHAREEVLA